MSALSRVRRRTALLLLGAWLLVLGLGFEVSACPPGMDTGMEMAMPTDGGGQASEDGHAPTTGGMECPFGGVMDDEGRTSCPLAVGGIGVCAGAGATSPSEAASFASLNWADEAPLVVLAASGPSPTTEIQLPPPRA